jgi:hypothetical protein
MMHVFVCDFRKGNIFSQLQWMGLALRKGFPVYPFLKVHVFTFLSFSLKTGISEGCNKDVKLVSREINVFIAFSCFMAPENAKIFQVLQAGVIL